MSTAWDGQDGRCGTQHHDNACECAAREDTARAPAADPGDDARANDRRNPCCGASDTKLSGTTPTGTILRGTILRGTIPTGTIPSSTPPPGTTAPVRRIAAKPAARHEPSRRARMQDGPALHAALDYRARRLCTAIDARGGNVADGALLDRLRPAGALLLRWWCSATACRMRVDNFNAVQRQALLHALLAHDILRSDDPGQLYRRACDPRPFDDDDRIDDDAHHRLRLAPGSGLRWVLQALLVWRWADAHDASQPAPSPDVAEFVLVAATPALARGLRAALLGDAHAAGDGSGHASIDESSLLRHARLFLPPALRAPFRAWLQAQRDGAGALRILDARDAAMEMPEGAALRLIAKRVRNPDDATTCTTRRLRIDLHVAMDMIPETDADASAVTALADVPLAQAILRGACKLPVLEAVDIRGLPLRTRPPRRTGLRPRLSRAHRRLLAAGLRGLRQREDGFVALDPARRPRMRVLCTSPLLLRAARRWLIDADVAADAIAVGEVAEPDACTPGDAAAGGAVRAHLVLVDDAPVESGLCDARICVVVVLRTDRVTAARRIATMAAVAGAALLWPEPDFADLRSENVERAVLDRAPRHLIDALSIVDDPRCFDQYAALPSAHGATADLPATDDLFATPLREDAAAFDMPLPAPCGESPRIPPERLSDLPRRILRARHALPVAKSVHAHAPCSALDSGLRRALLECAEADPAIDSHCLLDPRRHGAHGREAWLAQCASSGASMGTSSIVTPMGTASGTIDARGWPDALVRTADRIYLVELLPFCPAAPHAPGPSERAMLHWLRQLDARPPDQRGHRRWCRAPLPAPLFWSWKRSGGALSTLLSMLADGGRRRDG